MIKLKAPFTLGYALFMRVHRLERLKLLSQGIALLGMGGQTACHDQPPEMVHINAPYVVYDAGSMPHDPPVMNAPEPVQVADASAAPIATVATSDLPGPSSSPGPHASAAKAIASPPKIINAAPKHEGKPEP